MLDTGKYGTPGSARFGSFDTFKIASMKNPPIIWFDPK
jgi:hypothetical protein